jgi:hypothetical protein
MNSKFISLFYFMENYQIYIVDIFHFVWYPFNCYENNISYIQSGG